VYSKDFGRADRVVVDIAIIVITVRGASSSKPVVSENGTPSPIALQGKSVPVLTD